MFKYATRLFEGLEDRTKFSMSIISSSGIALSPQSDSATLSVKLVKEMTDDIMQINWQKQNYIFFKYV